MVVELTFFYTKTVVLRNLNKRGHRILCQNFKPDKTHKDGTKVRTSCPRVRVRVPRRWRPAPWPRLPPPRPSPSLADGGWPAQCSPPWNTMACNSYGWFTTTRVIHHNSQHFFSSRFKFGTYIISKTRKYKGTVSKKVTKTELRNNFFFKQKLWKSTYLTTSILSMRSLAVSNALTPTTGTAKPVE